MSKILGSAENWESGKLGMSEDHAVQVSTEETAAIERAAGMKLVSIRLPVVLVSNLKEIAKYYGIGYQPMVRDLMERFARSEIRTILEERLGRMEEKDQPNDEKLPDAATQPVSNFIEKERKRA